MKRINYRTIIAVDLACIGLSDPLIIALNKIVQADENPCDKEFYNDRVKHLFTEANGTKMHPETKRALAQKVADL